MSNRKISEMAVDLTPAATDIVPTVDPSLSTLPTANKKPAWSALFKDIAVTADETAALVTPVDLRYPVLHVLRYGINTTPGTTNMSTAAQNMMNVAQQIAANVNSSTFFRHGPIVDFGDEQLLFNTEVIWRSGVTIRSGGAELIAGTNGMTVLRTETGVETTANYSVFGSRNMSVIGQLIINGDAKASMGLDAETTSKCDFINISITGCTFQQFTGLTGTATSGDATLASTSSTTNVRVGDVVRLTIVATVSNLFYTVISKTASTLVFDIKIDATGATTAEAVGVGALFRMVQQGTIDIHVDENWLGVMFSENVNGFQCTDLNIRFLHCEENEAGAAFNRISGCRNVAGTFQHSKFGPELSISRRVVGNEFFFSYVESISDANAEAEAVGRTAVLQLIPLIHIDDNASGQIFHHIRFPTNPSAVVWRRLMRNAGNDTIVGLISSNVAALNVNPARALDFAPIEQDSSAGGCSLFNGWVGQTTITDPTTLLIDESGVYNPSPRSFAQQNESGTLRQFGTNRYYGKTTAFTIIDVFNAAETNPRFNVTPKTLSWGGGSGAVDTNLFRDAANVLKTDDAFVCNTLLTKATTEDVITTNVITADESGTTFYLNLVGGFTSTLPAAAAGLEFTFIVQTAPTTAYIIATDSGDNVLFGTFLDIVGELVYFSAQDTLNFVASTSLVGDRLEVESDGTNWYCKAFSGADGGITVSVT